MRLRFAKWIGVMSAPRENRTRKGSLMTGRFMELGRLFSTCLPFFHSSALRLLFEFKCPASPQDFSRILPFCGPLLGYSLIIGVNIFSHGRILRTVKG